MGWYRSSRRRILSPVEFGAVVAAACFLAGFFYRSMGAVLPMMVPAGFLIWWERKKRGRTGDRELLKQFGECILSVSSAMKAGYAAENAFLESMKDMEMMYGRSAEILGYLREIKGGLANHLPLEALLQEMAEKTGLKEIREFSEVFAITKRNGGNLADIIQMTAEDIRARLNGEAEIRTVLASRQMEQRIMNAMPFLLVMYLELTTPGYFDMFFQDISGTLIMTLFLIWYAGAYCLSEYVFWKVLE